MSEDKIIHETVDKPTEWPANAREARLSNILDTVKRFIEKPNYKNKEILISLVSQVDLNEGNHLGLHRVTEYEVAIINELYELAMYMMFYDLKVFLYQQIAYTSQQQKMAYQITRGSGIIESLEIKAYDLLYPPLALFYQIYANFNIGKTRSFPDQLIHEINSMKNNLSSEMLQRLSWMLNTLLIDLSWFPSAKISGFLKLTRQDLEKVFALQANLIKLTNQSPLVRPLKGVLCIIISNWILKSRNGYNEDFLIKYLPDSINLNEIWMQEIKYLNDKREQTLIKELYKIKNWIKFEWARKVDLAQIRKTYVSSFSKSPINPEMQKEYGKNIYGYKSDRIRYIIAPINLVNNKVPQFGHVICYDIIYDINEAKEEINFLCKIINLYNITPEEKNAFLNELIQYWILSFKDKKWEYEKERRYQVFIDPNYDYIELNTYKKYLKIKNSLFALPDFISKDNSNKNILKLNRKFKLKALSRKPYIFCDDCLNTDYDNLYSFDKKKKCYFCGSDKVQKIEIK